VTADLDPIRVQMRAARQATGLSLEKMAEKAGIHVAVLGSWERGTRNPTLPQLRRWVAAFGRTLVVLEPGQRVLNGDEFITWHVVLPSGGAVLNEHTRAGAEAMARQIPGSRVAYRVCARGPLEFGGAS